MKIICVGHNYQLHNEEMGRLDSDQVQDPILFLKPDSSILKDNKPLYIPDFTNDLQYELEVVVKISRLGKNIAEKFANRYYEELSVGIDFTARDLQRELKKNGLPWEISKGFDNSAVLGEFVDKNTLSNGVNHLDFELKKNGLVVQNANTEDMIHSIDKIIAYASRFFTLKIGDLIYTGTPAGVGAVAINDRMEGFLDEKKLFDFYIR